MTLATTTLKSTSTY